MGLLSGGGVPNGTVACLFLSIEFFLLNLLLLLLRQMFSLCHLLVVPMHNAQIFFDWQIDDELLQK